MRLRIAEHPLHPALVHFPIALWFIAVFWDAAAWWRPDPLWRQMAYWSLASGLVLALPVLATGLLDYLALRSDEPAIDAATAHMMVMMSATVAFGASWMLRAADGVAAPPSTWALAAALLGAVLLAVGGWLGGTLVYRHGVGRAYGEGNGGGRTAAAGRDHAQSQNE
jgi:uncharacterized membrane protein